jgi:phosphoenolpyruvate carboxylase
MQQASDALREQVGDSAEPYRAVLKQLRDRLRATRAWAHARSAGNGPGADVLHDNRELLDPLELCSTRCMNAAWA